MASDDGSWAPVRQRVAWVRAVRRAVARRHEEITGVVSREIGKPVFECFVSEIVPLLRAARLAERRIGGVMRERRMAGGGVFSPGVTVRERRVPLGRVGIIATWNYPVGLLGVQALQAIGCGNAVVVKASERSPESQRLLMEIMERPGNGVALPGGVVEVMEATRQAGVALAARGGDPDATRRIDHLVFTGSTEVGAQIAARLGATLTPSTLELSGRDTAIVLDDADAGLAARSIWASVRLNAGQTCMAPRRAIVCAGVYGAFATAIEGLARHTPRVRLVCEQERARGERDVPEAVRAGARLVTGADATEGSQEWMGVTALLECPAGASIVAGRHFGPVLAVVRARDEAEALSLHAMADQRLSTSVFTRDVTRARREIAPLLGSTLVTINDSVVPTGHPDVSIGGVGRSGWGVSRGVEGLRSMTRPVWVTTTSARVRMPTQMLEGAGAARFMRYASRLLGR